MAAGERGKGRRPMMTLLVLSIPFLLIAGFCLAMSSYAGGWDGLGWAVYMAIALGAWAAMVAGFFVWLMVRDGLLAWHGIPLLILTAALVAGAVWGGKLWWQDAACKADGAFFDQLAAAPVTQRPAMLALAPRPLDALTYCGCETITMHFLADRYAPRPASSQEETDRLATLALLLERGLPPDDSLFHQAVAAADPQAVRLLIAQRKALGERAGEAVPLRFAEQALAEVDTDPSSPYHAHLEPYLAILTIMIENGLDICQPSRAATFRDAMVRKGVPETVWRVAGGC